MTASPIASPANIAAAEAKLGGPILGNDLVTSVQQLVIAIGAGSGGGGGGSVAFSAITGNATDNPSLVATFVQKAGDTMTGALINATAAAASTPALALTGAIFTGGSATTTKPKFLIEPAGTTSNNWGTSGTAFGINAASGFAGNLVDLQLNGSARLKVTADGSMTFGSASASGVFVLSMVTSTGTVGFGVTGGNDLFLTHGLVVSENRVVRFGFTGGTDPILAASASTLTLSQANFVLASGGVLRLGNTAAVGVGLVSTHSVTIQDATGTTYRIPVLV